MNLLFIDELTADFLAQKNIKKEYLTNIKESLRNPKLFKEIINNYNKDINIDLSQLMLKELKARKIIGWQDESVKTFSIATLIETGYLHTICPWEGKIIKTNVSFSSSSSSRLFFYQFKGKNTFYLIYCPIGTLGFEGIYIPDEKLIISFRQNLFVDLKKTVESLNVQLAKHDNHKIKKFTESEAKKIALLMQNTTSFGHAYWNDLTGIHTLVNSGLLDKIDKFLVAKRSLVDIAVFFPEIPASKIKLCDDNNEIQQYVIDNNYCLTQIRDFYITNSLIDRIKTIANQQCTGDFIKQFEVFKNTNYPLLWIAIRCPSSKRGIWKSQVESLANIINELSTNYPQIGIVFDGWSRISELTEKDLLMIEKEKNIAKEIQSLIPENIKVYNLIGATPYEKIVVADAITTYIAPFGSTLTIISWIADKVGVSHENLEMLRRKPLIRTYSAGFRENMTSSTIVIPEELVTQLEDGYECDWRWIYTQVKSVIEKDTYLKSIDDNSGLKFNRYYTVGKVETDSDDLKNLIKVKFNGKDQEQNYFAFSFVGDLTSGTRINTKIKVQVEQKTTIKLMLIRDGSNRPEGTSKLYDVESGLHELSVGHLFENEHPGLRIQIGVESNEGRELTLHLPYVEKMS